jgi:hypothetical protein
MYAGYFFPAVKVMHSFWRKIGWTTFWAIFHKLIWSPWFHVRAHFFPMKDFFPLKNDQPRSASRLLLS